MYDVLCITHYALCITITIIVSITVPSLSALLSPSLSAVQTALLSALLPSFYERRALAVLSLLPVTIGPPARERNTYVRIAPAVAGAQRGSMGRGIMML